MPQDAGAVRPQASRDMEGDHDGVGSPRTTESSRESKVASSQQERLGSVLASSPLAKWIVKEDKDMQKLRASAAARRKTIEIEQEEQQQLRAFHSELQAVLKWLAFLTVVSISLGIVINEVCASTDYLTSPPPDHDLDTIEFGEGRKCSSSIGEPLKVAGSALTAAVIYFTMKRQGVKLMLRLTKRRHLKAEALSARAEQDLPPTGAAAWAGLWLVWLLRKSPPRWKLWLLLELFVCCVHQFPMVAMDIKVIVLGRRMFYRFESISCGVMMLRLYHIWRWVYLSAYLHYFDMEHTFLVQDQATIHLMRDGSVRKRRLAVKVGVSQHPLRVIAVAILMVVVVISYLVRIAEGPAHQKHSKYYWDQMWLTITQGTTGYGDSTPQTHLGRFFSLLMMLCGPIFVAFVTATTTRFLEMSAEDKEVVWRMDENRLKRKLLEAAALLLQHWFRMRKASKQIDHLRAPALEQQSFRSRMKTMLRGQEQHTELLKQVCLCAQRLCKFRARSKSSRPRVAAPPATSPAHEDVMREVQKVMLAVQQVSDRVQRVEAGVGSMLHKSEACSGCVAHQADQPGCKDGQRNGELRTGAGQLQTEAHRMEERVSWVASASAEPDARPEQDGSPRRSRELGMRSAMGKAKMQWGQVGRNHSAGPETETTRESSFFSRAREATPRSSKSLVEFGQRVSLKRQADKGGGGGGWRLGSAGKEDGKEQREGLDWSGVEAELVMWKGEDGEIASTRSTRR